MKFSIITISFNSEKTIARTISSVLKQEEAVYEYIIVDGMSSDLTCAIAESYRNEFDEKNIHYHIISEKDEGIYDAMNKGISLATGDVVGMINSDDWYESHAIKVMNEVFEVNQISMAYADIRIITKNRTIIKHSKYDRFPTSRHWNHPTTFIKRDVYNQFHYKNETIFDDWDLILRIRREGLPYMIVPEVLANFSFGGTSNSRSIKNTIYRIKLKTKIFRQNGYSIFHFFDSAFIEIAKYIFG
jgi:glycosyltransferase involved in cell wall biosynthesis